MTALIDRFWRPIRLWLAARSGQIAGTNAHSLALTVNDGAARLAKRFDALSVRERGLIAIATAATLLATWDALAMRPLYARERAVRARLAAIAPEGIDSSVSLTDLDDLVQRDRIYTRRYNSKWAELQGKAATLIEPQRMSEVLTELIAAIHGIRLVRLANLPVEELRSSESADSTANNETLDTGSDELAVGGSSKVPAVAYVHGLEIVVEGDYRTIYRYLQAVEAQRWRFIWRKAELDATTYPVVQARIVVATLGLDRYWLVL